MCDWSWVDAWQSTPRFSRYLGVCDNDYERALGYYQLNMDVSLALFRAISCFEIALRNAYDRALTDGWGPDWTTNGTSPVRVAQFVRARGGRLTNVNHANARDIDQAVQRIGHSGKQVTHDRIISDLTFGFWAHLADRRHERLLWTPYLHHAWPRGTKRADVDSLTSIVNRVRNRIAHHEHVLDPTHLADHPLVVESDIITMTRMLSPDLAAWIWPAGELTCVQRLLATEQPSRRRPAWHAGQRHVDALLARLARIAHPGARRAS